MHRRVQYSLCSENGGSKLFCSTLCGTGGGSGLFCSTCGAIVMHLCRLAVLDFFNLHLVS